MHHHSAKWTAEKNIRVWSSQSALIKKSNQKCLTAFSTTRRRNWTFIKWKTKKHRAKKKMWNQLNQKLDWSFTSNKTHLKKLKNIHLTALILTKTRTKTKIRNTDLRSKFAFRSWFIPEKPATKKTWVGEKT